MFATVSIPFAEFQSLPTPQDRWALTALIRYCNKAGECWPSLKQLGTDLGVSESTACRWLQRLAACGVFEVRRRSGNGRYRYRIAQRYLPRWPGKASTPRLAGFQSGLAPSATQEAKPLSKEEAGRKRPRFGRLQGSPYELLDMTSQWQARITSWRQSGGKFWLDAWGEKPGCHGSLVPPELLQMAS